MILFHQVSKQFKTGTWGIKNVSFRIKEGEFVSLIGPSGAGKSTLLSLITAEDRQYEGDIYVEGMDIKTIKNHRLPYYRRKVGTIYQDFKLLKHKNAFENIAFALEMVGKSPKEIKEIVNNVLTLVGLKDKGHQFPNEMSGGERQRVAIARALIHQPKIIVADEPSGNLDTDTSWEIVQLLQRINSFGATILLATHDEDIVNALRRRVISIQNGQIVSDRKVGRYR